MIIVNQEQFLQAILEKTSHVHGGIEAQDMDIVHNALDEREDLISQYAKKKFGPANKGKCAELADRVKALDAQNSKLLKVLMDDASEKIFEARRELKALETGKKATKQYRGTQNAGHGEVLDFKQ
ncbi:MAG: hypothetical protein FWE57_04565 [Chitinispirillia bacterium]|nr:hypothetical protein [Chitinispirillia bacterium]